MQTCYGPFGPSDLNGIEEVLKESQVEYEITDDDGLSEHYRSKPPPGLSGGAIPAHRNLYLLVDSEELRKVSHLLENYSINPNPVTDIREFTNNDLEQEEYLCTQCNFVSNQPGQCPDHQVDLISFSEYVQWSNSKKDRAMSTYLKIFWLSFLGFILAAVLSRYF